LFSRNAFSSAATLELNDIFCIVDERRERTGGSDLRGFPSNCTARTEGDRCLQVSDGGSKVR
jgi:hypothetical protein